jgi:hypothetical protein
MVKDASNNWALNSATGRAGQLQGIPEHQQRRHLHQCIELTGVVRVNYETGSGTQFKVYGGNSSTLCMPASRERHRSISGAGGEQRS